MSNEHISHGFPCPKGTRIIIQRPDGYFTALIEGTVRIKVEVEPGDIATPSNGGLGIPDRLIGGTLSLDTKMEASDDVLYTVALGQYGEEQS